MWMKRTIKAGIALAGCVLVVTALDPARGGVDANERVKGIVNGLVETASMSPAGTPFELTAAETAKIGTRPMVERLGISGELQPITRVVIRARGKQDRGNECPRRRYGAGGQAARAFRNR